MQRSSPENKGAKRSQVSRACSRCKKHRRKCSDFRPCRRCLDQGLGEECLASPGLVHINAPLPTSDESAEQPPDVPSAAIIDFCADHFFERLFPTIPIITPDYVLGLREAARTENSTSSTEARSLLSAICALVLLQAQDPDQTSASPTSQPAASGEEILKRATQSFGGKSPTASPSLEQVLLAFFLYACHAALLRHSLAFFYLRDATTLWHLRDAHPHGDSYLHSALHRRLFWVLLVSERSHAIRYRRSITLLVDPGTEPPENIALLAGYSSLAALFRPLNTSFFGLLNREESSPHSPPEFLANTEDLVNAALDTTVPLHDTQRANLRITQLWLRIVLWQMRLRAGYLKQESTCENLTYAYPLRIARELVIATNDLTVTSMSVHGVGLTEKLFDIAVAVIDVLARVPVAGSGSGTASPDAGEAHRDLGYLRGLIRKLPSGQSVYDELLERQIETCTSMPGLPAGMPASNDMQDPSKH
ncbi:hypothetical protein QBC34DRAFT_352336 [Podospora aff. communis PSN243]|uniref:Zn(2)-C6 fungal-type domain-containing protein n=1 Tax=Podospora aff. communis PSN243 TaxID=3040156 RepID=A0AAV9GLS7_9PEZI|nr:hypothetical protein QBC34DRAFT_352336 [Podospora aff. communis PSN243]